MKFVRSWSGAATAVVLSALLAACGGGGNDAAVAGSGSPSGAPTTRGSFTAVVSFGDSLSDVGTYAPATGSLAGNGTAPYLGGKFTTNSATAKVWLENVATTLGLAVTPAEVGFNGASVKCPAALVSAALGATCTGYGQGGSRVTDPAGIGRTSTGAGALTVPVKTQIANHLARFGSFKASDLVFVYAGNNDAFTQLAVFAAKAAPIQTQQLAGTLSADQARLALFNAQTEGQAAMKQAALELASYVRTEILAKGAVYVAVMNLPDSSLTPFGATLSADAKGVLSGFVATFNLWLREGLTGAPVQIVDANAQFSDAYANPAKYGFVDNTHTACDPAAISAITGGLVTDGSSLFCNATPSAPYNGLRTGADVTTWAFADGVHPTTGGHKVFSDYVLVQLRSYGWIQ